MGKPTNTKQYQIVVEQPSTINPLQAAEIASYCRTSAVDFHTNLELNFFIPGRTLLQQCNLESVIINHKLELVTHDTCEAGMIVLSSANWEQYPQYLGIYIQLITRLLRNELYRLWKDPDNLVTLVVFNDDSRYYDEINCIADAKSTLYYLRSIN